MQRPDGQVTGASFKYREMSFDVKMANEKSQLELFKERNSPGIEDDGIILKSDLIVRGIAQESPPFINTCNTNTFLSALRFSFFYNSGNFSKNFRHTRSGPKKIEDAIKVIGTLCKEIDVDPSLVKMAWNTIPKVCLIFILKNKSTISFPALNRERDQGIVLLRKKFHNVVKKFL